MTNSYEICTRCIMDTTDPDIQFDEKGICNHCRKYEQRARNELHYDEAGRQELNRLVNEIKRNGRDKEYDCIIGLSGGVDSTFVAYVVKKLGLRPLAVQFDNGWDPEITTSNIENIVKNLDMDLYNYRVDWHEFRDLQLSFMKASVSNCEIPTDHGLTAFLYRTAAEKGQRYIISGSNLVTEGILPASWGYNWMDLRFIKGIHRRFGEVELKNYPQLGLLDWVYYTLVRRIRYVRVLYYVPYVRKDAKELIQKELGWKDYGPKHFESIYTRFFQAYILPKKFNIDKRRAHLSTLICSGQMTREEALEEIKRDPYATQKMLKEDREYVIRKLGLTEEEFEGLMSQPIKSFTDYPNNYFLFSKLDFLVRFAKKRTTDSY